MAKTESGSDDPPGTLALCGHDAAEHCRGSAHQFFATIGAIMFTRSYLICPTGFKIQKVQRPFHQLSS